VRQTGKWLLCLPGTDSLDPELTVLGNTGIPVAYEALAYLQFGGVDNYAHLLRFLADHLLAGGFGFDSPVQQPEVGVYHPDLAVGASLEHLRALHDPLRPTLGLLFYRAHLLSGNTDFVDALVHEIEACGANAMPVYAHSLKDDDTIADHLPAAMRFFTGADGCASVDAVIATARARIASTGATRPVISST